MLTVLRTATVHPRGAAPSKVRTSESKINPGLTPVPAMETDLDFASASSSSARFASTAHG
ncbi:unannotated protein [freshwater metagenome]|uniref:Unannotated protein n=1 Tax=freshwater metagenome TaxID=449393 RepID=A0A6J6P7Y1_9ZZZZ